MLHEHIGINIKDAGEMAKWYCENLGLTVVRDTGAAYFLADSTGRTLLEIYTNPAVKQIDYALMGPGSFHIAFVSEDIALDREKLIKAGGKADGETFFDGGDEFSIIRDPWGISIQLVKREIPMD